jgi:uncharacterized membrane protein YfcA
MALALPEAAALFAVALLGGVLNAVAGGGGFVFFPALIFAGVPTIRANATSTVVSWPGLVAGAVGYRAELVALRRRTGEQRGAKLPIWLYLVSSVVGGWLGAQLLLRTPPLAFDRLVPWLLLVATALFAFGGRLVAWLRAGSAHGHPHRGIGFTLYFITAVYGGFYGGGIGILVLATLSLLGMQNLHEMNALKMPLMVAINAPAVAAFIVAGAVAWPQAAVMIVGSVLGGYGGAEITRRMPQLWVRRGVIAIGLALSAYFFLRRR